MCGVPLTYLEGWLPPLLPLHEADRTLVTDGHHRMHEVAREVEGRWLKGTAGNRPSEAARAYGLDAESPVGWVGWVGRVGREGM